MNNVIVNKKSRIFRTWAHGSSPRCWFLVALTIMALACTEATSTLSSQDSDDGGTGWDDTSGDADTDADGDADTDADGDADTDADGDTDTDADGDADTDADSDTDGDADTDAVPCTEDNAETLCDAADLCVDGYCCNSTCTGECEGCAEIGNRGTCSRKAATVVCRAAVGDCDQPETCTGTSSTCPTDRFNSNSEECRAATSPCDFTETCTGNSADCPEDGFQSSGLECRASAGLCDIAESCTGTSGDCPEDGFEPSTKECRAFTGVGCATAAEYCLGDSPTCPTNNVGPVEYPVQSFDTGDLPTGWDIIDGDGYDADGYAWTHTTNSPPDTGSGGHWVIDSDACHCNMSDSIVTETYDVSGCGSVSLDFDHYYRYDSGDTGSIEAQINGGNWTSFQTYTSSNQSHQTLSHTLPADVNTIRLKFYYQASDDWFWKIDNIRVTGNVN